jgi:glutamyl/glutaminyl-tRNA synthetase
MPPEDFIARLRAHAEKHHPQFLEKLGDRFDLFARANHGRSKTLDDPFRTDHFFIVDDESIVYQDSKPVRKALEKGEPNGYAHLEALIPVLEQVDPWTVENLEQALAAYAGDHAGGKLGPVAQPLRIAVSGGPVSPAIHETLVILGKDSVINRIRHCLGRREWVRG